MEATPDTRPSESPAGPWPRLLAIPTDMGTRALVRAIHRAGSERDWSDHGGLIVPTHTLIANDGRGAVRVSLRGLDGQAVPAADVLPTLWREVRRLGDLTSDALLVCLVRWLTLGSGPREPVWVSVDDVLEARGVRPKRNREEPGNWHHGHRIEDRFAVGRALAQLDALWLDIDAEVMPARGRRAARRLRCQSKAFAMLDAVTQADLDGRAVFLRARVMPGSWAERLSESDLHQSGVLAREALGYDGYHERAEKRLAKFLAFHFRVNALRPDASVRLQVATLLDHADLSPDPANPQRTWRRLERALDRLRSDGVVADWHYATDGVDEGLPARGWFTRWAATTMVIAPPLEVAARYAGIGRSIGCTGRASTPPPVAAVGRNRVATETESRGY